MNRIRLTSGLFVLGLLLAVSAGADAGRGRHQKLYVVPTPGKITIDGQLNDWDLSGQIWIYVVSETADMMSAKLAMMYDADALYLSGVVRDSSPMMNRHDPQVDPERAWDADVCQVFLSLDPALGHPVTVTPATADRLATMYLWHYTDRQEACLAMFGGQGFSHPFHPDQNPKGVVPHAKYAGAYAKAADGRGYTFEYRLPYATLGIKQPVKPDDLLAATACFFWGSADGLKTAGGAAWAYDIMAQAGFPWQSAACWGKLIFSPKGQLAKDLVEEGLPPEKPLPLTFEYDLPEDCQATIQLFDEHGNVARTLVAQGERRAGRNFERWDGLDAAGKPLAPGTYTRRGLFHHGITTRFLCSAHNSGQPPYHTDDNTGTWGGDHGNPTTVCAAGDGMVLAWEYSEAGFGIIRTDLAGKKRWGIKHNATDLATDGTRLFVTGDAGFEGEKSVKIFAVQDGRPMNWGNGQVALSAPPAPQRDGISAAEGGGLATAVAYAPGRVFVSWTTNNLVGVYDATSGELKQQWTVPSPGRLVPRPDGSVAVISAGQVLTVKDGPATTLIATHLDAPRGIAVDRDGTIYVANAGQLQNISVFDATGRYLRSIGKPGGRPAVGRYDPNGVYQPGGIALDPQGRLWVAETTDAPKRHSVWDAKSGAFVREFFGACSYFGWAWLDPRQPDELYCHDVIWKVDWKTNTCTPYSTIWRATAPNMVVEPNPGGYGGHFRVITARNGKQYGFGMAYFGNLLYRRDGDLFKPCAGTFAAGFSQNIYPVVKAVAEKTKAGALLWQDQNDDQIIQAGELSVSPAGRGEMAFNWIDGDLNAWCDAGWMYQPVRVEPDGRPVYDFAQPTPIPFRGANANAGSMIVDDSAKAVYVLAPETQAPEFGRYTRDGKPVWRYTGLIPWYTAINLPALRPGVMNALTMPLGIAGEFTGAASYFGVFNLVTTDGVYVAQCFRDGRLGGTLGPDTLNSETIIGQLVKPDGMTRYFFLGGAADGRVTEILGLDTVKRLPDAPYVHRAEMAARARQAQETYQKALAKNFHLAITRGKPSLASNKPATKCVDSTREFNARVAYDDQNLYVAYEVTSPNDLLNDASDPKLIFKGGNLLDIQLAADPSADPRRQAPAPGDVRLLVSRRNGQPVVVLYRPKVKGFTGQPTVLTSPTGKESFDLIEVADKVGLEYTKTPTGFKAVVTIPLATIGLAPKPGQTIPLDFGYIFGNATGQAVSVRAYWTNNSFASGVNNDVPNESRLEPAKWGTATVE